MMNEKDRQFVANGIFPSLFLAALGFVLAQASASQLNGSWQVHAVLGIPGIALSGLALRRARLHWPATIGRMPGRSGDPRWPSSARGLASCLLLFSIGIAIALATRSVLLLGTVAPLIYLVPWARIKVCRQHFVASFLSTLAGAIACLTIGGLQVPFLHNAIVAWMALVPPFTMMLLVIVSLPSKYRMREPGQTKNVGLDSTLSLPG